MFSNTPILIVEDNVFLALDLSQAIEEMNGRIVGPTALVSEALDLLQSRSVGGAIVDGSLADQEIGALTERLARHQVPFVLHAASELPASLTRRHATVPVLRKPVESRLVLACLLTEIAKSGPRAESGPAVAVP